VQIDQKYLEVYFEKLLGRLKREGRRMGERERELEKGWGEGDGIRRTTPP
jgi:hypothetical protein